MDDKKKKILYFSLIFVMAIAFIALYILDNEMSKSEGSDAFSVFYNALHSNTNDDAEDNENADTSSQDSISVATPISISNYEKLQVINWDKSKIDSIQIFSQRKDFTLINNGSQQWSIRSVRLNERVPKSNRAFARLTNVFTGLTTNNYLTKDYSELSKYFEYPICTVVANFQDGAQRKMAFIRIAEVNELTGEVEMKTWVRTNDDTVVYATTYNILERFLAKEKDFIKLY